EIANFIFVRARTKFDRLSYAFRGRVRKTMIPIRHPMHEPRSRNYIMSTLSSPDMGLLNPHLEHVDLPVRTVLEVPNHKIEYVYFPEGGLASVVAAAGRSR